MTGNIKQLMVFAALPLLVACGGGGVTPIMQMPQTGYETLSSSSDATSGLGGVASVSNGTTGGLALASTMGELSHSDGALILDDGAYRFVAPAGIVNGIATDGASVVTIDTGLPNDAYDYVTAYNQTYTSNGGSFDSFGVIGVISDPNDLGTADASFEGSSVATLTTNTQGLDLSEGRSTVTVNLGTGQVSATLQDFHVTDQLTGDVTTASFDTIRLEDMRIIGNRFGGENITLLRNGNPVDVIESNAAGTTQGAFFGFDATRGGADEVGGIFQLKGDDGLLIGGFIAD